MRKYWYYIIVFCGVLVLAGCGKEGALYRKILILR